MAIHWRCRFKSLNGTSYSVNIYDAAYSGNTPTELVGAAVPFETIESNGVDVMSPVRLSTGTLRVVNTNDLSDMMPQTPKGRPVTLTHEENNATIIDWQGYIQQAQFTQQWNSTPYEVEFPLISSLSILSGNQIVKGEMSARARIAKYFQMAIAASGGTYTHIVFPAEIGMSNDGAWDSFWRFGIQERNWFEYKNENVLDVDESRYEGVSWLDMMSAIMQSFGFVLYERGQIIYIVSNNATHYLKMAVSQLATLADNGTATETTETPSAVSISSLQIGGSNGTIDMVPVKRKAVAEGNINPFEEDSTPQIDSKYLDFAAKLTVAKQQTGSAGTYYFNETLGVYEPEQGTDIWTFRSFLSGVEQTWSGQNITGDYHVGAFCRRISGENILFINYNNVGNGATGWGGDWTIAVKSSTETFFAGGFFLFQGGVELNQGTGAAVTGTYRGVFMLRVGDKYYNVENDTWQTTACTFYAAIDPNTGRLEPYNTYNAQNGDGKIYIKVPESGLFGDVELRFYDPVSSAGTQQEHQAVYVFSNITVDYIWPIQDVFKDDAVTDTNRFVKQMRLFAQEDAERSIKVTSYINNRMGYGVLLKPDYSAPLGKIYDRRTAENVYFEETLINALYAAFNTAQKILSIPIRRDGQFSPLDSYTWNGSHKYLSSRTNWRDSLQYLQIYKNL